MNDLPVMESVVDGVATITLNRPTQMNSLDRPTKLALLQALRTAQKSASVRAVLLAAEGRGFCVGQDLREFVQDRDNSSPAEVFRTVEEHFNPISHLIATMNKPVVAAVQGAAAGAGMSLALAADFRVASTAATFTTAFSAIGLSPDSGMSWYLPRLVGAAKATELLMLSPTLSAQQALQLGLVTEVVTPDQLAATAHSLAARLAQGPTLAYERIKELVRKSGERSLVEGLTNEYVAVAATGATEDHDGAFRAFLAKEKYHFSGR
jgi:2-(1,2-epoxy-1,2-dihydrophenyl)acetyl-CoA isomerase